MNLLISYRIKEVDAMELPEYVTVGEVRTVCKKLRLIREMKE
jgi:hypothetical protein